MRERKSFNERTKVKESDQVKIKYFLVFEGSETEEIYFDAINSHRVELGIDPIIELIPLVRDFGEEGWSNPKKIVDRIVENVEEAESGKMTYDVLINRIMDYMMSLGIAKGKKQCTTLWNTLKWLCKEKIHKELNDEVSDVDSDTKELVDLLIENSLLENVADNIAEVIKSLSITYDSEIDKICLIVDRDRDSFVVNEKKNQYQYVLDACKKNKFSFHLTNPCFEFWLLLHFDDVTELDEKMLLENPLVTKKKKYTEDELTKRIRFKKNHYDADALVANLFTAIQNEKKYCEDIEMLESTVGSNLGNLFDEILTV